MLLQCKILHPFSVRQSGSDLERSQSTSESKSQSLVQLTEPISQKARPKPTTIHKDQFSTPHPLNKPSSIPAPSSPIPIPIPARAMASSSGKSEREVCRCVKQKHAALRISSSAAPARIMPMISSTLFCSPRRIARRSCSTKPR